MQDGIVRNEIGSEFWDIPLQEKRNKLIPKETKWFISGTSALEWIVRDLVFEGNVSSVSLPSWCCSCMIEPFVRNNINVQFYPVFTDENNRLVCDYSNTYLSDATLVISYFGYTQQQSIGMPTGIIIRDITHSVLSQNYNDATYYFGSLRKWAGFWTGGYCWKSGSWDIREEIPPIDPYYTDLRRQAMEEKHSYLQGKNHQKSYLLFYQKAEEYLDQCMLMEGSQRDTDAAWHLNISEVKKKRRENARILLGELSQYALFPELQENDCPLFVPIILDPNRRDALRSYLIQHDIYCPIHWELSELHKLTTKEQHLYNTEMSIVCDQRYNTKDMSRITEEIMAFFHN